MTEPIPEDRWLAIEANIVANLKLPALKEIRALAGCSLSEALSIFGERYVKLRAEAPERFDCSHREYVGGVLLLTGCGKRGRTRRCSRQPPPEYDVVQRGRPG